MDGLSIAFFLEKNRDDLLSKLCLRVKSALQSTIGHLNLAGPLRRAALALIVLRVATLSFAHLLNILRSLISSMNLPYSPFQESRRASGSRLHSGACLLALGNSTLCPGKARV